MSDISSSNVVSLAERRAKRGDTKLPETTCATNETGVDLEAIAAKNRANAERVRKERIASNNATMRSLRNGHIGRW